MTKPSYLAVILVLASKGELYDKFRYYWSLMDKMELGIKVHYVYGDSNTSPQPGDLVYNIPETYYPGMLHKSLKAIEYVNDTYNYQYIIRTNLSTFWDLPQLLKRLFNMLNENMLAGSLRRCYHNNQYYDYYLNGTNQVYSKDLVEKIVEAIPTLWNMGDLPEDLVISRYCLQELKIPRSGTGAIKIMEDYSTVDDSAVEDIMLARKIGVDNYRIKNSDRNVDIEIFKLLLEIIYNIRTDYET